MKDKYCYYRVGSYANLHDSATTGFRDSGAVTRYLPVYNTSTYKFIGLFFSGGSAIIDKTWKSSLYQVEHIYLVRTML